MVNNAQANVPTKSGAYASTDPFSMISLLHHRCLLPAFMLAALCAPATAGVETAPVEASRQIADKIGRAGMAAVLLPENGNHDMPVIMMAGGANFPYAAPDARTADERGNKVYYSDIAVMLPPDACSACDSHPTHAGRLPHPVAYAAFAPSSKGMVIAGGCNARGHTARVTRTELFGPTARTEELPDLPVSLAYPAFAVSGGQLYVMGGQESEESTACLARCFVLDLDDTDAGWEEIAPMPSPRMLAGAAALDGKIYIAGGCSLNPDEEGNPVRTYLRSVLCYDPETDRWQDMESPMPESLAGAANPLPVSEGKMYVIGGDPGDYYRAGLQGHAPSRHPGQNKTVYSFSPASKQWVREGENALGVATCPAVVSGRSVYTISGETQPGVRTPVITEVRMQP